MNLTYRDYQPQDKKQLTTFFDDLQKTVSALDPIKRSTWKQGLGEYCIKELIESFELYDGKCIVAETDNHELVGFIWGLISLPQTKTTLLSVVPSKMGVIKDFFVCDAYRGQHIGSALMTQMENYFKARGCDAIWLQVAAYNTHAFELYKKRGYLEREIELLKTI